jgi:hypothetical protein
MMRVATLAVISTLAIAAANSPVSATPPVVVAPVSAEPLLGQWRVDLTSSPAEGVKGRYYTDMMIDSVKGDRVTGTFYGSRMENGRINRSWGGIRFAFVTRDGGGGVYHHSGEMVDGRLIRGLSHAIDRDFLSVWTAQPGTIEKPAY